MRNEPEVYKVTAIVTRETADGRELLVFRHPTAGIQLPAGTNEEGETPKQALMREVFEETGLDHTMVELEKHLVTFHQLLQPGIHVMQRAVHPRLFPDEQSEELPVLLGRGHSVHVEEQRGDYVRIYFESPRMERGVLVQEKVCGWLPVVLVSDVVQRHIFHLTTTVPTPDSWQITSDRGFTFTLFWVNLNYQPGLIPPQDDWLNRALPFI